MPELIKFSENGIYGAIKIMDDGNVRLLYLGSKELDAEHLPEGNGYRLVQVKTADYGYEGHHGAKHITAGFSERLQYVSHTDTRSDDGKQRIVSVTQQADNIFVTSYLVFYSDIAVVRSYTTVENRSENNVTIEFLSSFCLFGISAGGEGSWDTKCNISIPHNTWLGESQWYKHSVSELGLSKVGWSTIKPLIISSTGTFSTDEYLPVGYFENESAGNSLMWQIENNGSWMWEVGDESNELYLLLSGPCQDTAGWWKTLLPGDSFESATTAVVFSDKGFNGTIAEMTK